MEVDIAALYNKACEIDRDLAFVKLHGITPKADKTICEFFSKAVRSIESAISALKIYKSFSEGHNVDIKILEGYIDHPTLTSLVDNSSPFYNNVVDSINK